MGLGNLHGLLGVGIPPHAGLAELGFKNAEAAESNLVPLNQGGGNGVQSGIDDPFRVLPGKPRLVGDGGDKFWFIHKKASPIFVLVSFHRLT